jgi:DNA-binding NarL/FixJ family response regulator
MRVILAEDDVLLREGIARIFGEEGYDVVEQAGDRDDLLERSARITQTWSSPTSGCRRRSPATG